MAGRLSHEELVAEYQRAWLVSSASLAEGWGLTLTEAAACGTPAVATDVSGHRSSVIDGVTGVLAPLDQLGEVDGRCAARRSTARAARSGGVGSGANPDVGCVGARDPRRVARPGRTRSQALAGQHLGAQLQNARARPAWRSCDGPNGRPGRCRSGAAGTSRSCSASISSFDHIGCQSNAAETCSMSNHSDFEYIIQW